MNTKKFLAVAALASAIVLFCAFDLHQYLSLDALRQSQAQLSALHAQSPWTVALGFFVVYVAATALSFPGATILTLAGGAILDSAGAVAGVLCINHRCHTGISGSAVLLRDWVQARFATRLAAIDKVCSAMARFISLACG